MYQFRKVLVPEQYKIETRESGCLHNPVGEPPRLQWRLFGLSQAGVAAWLVAIRE